MKKISIAFVAALSLMAFAGCKKKGGEMKAMRDDMCACKDAKCVDEVTKKYAKAGEGKEGKEPTEEDMKMAKEMTECAQKAMTGGGGDMKADDKGGGDKKPDDKAAGGDKKPDDKGAAPAAGGGDTGVKECDEVIAAYTKYFDCDKLKAAGDAAIKAQHDALDAMQKGWGDLKSAPQATKDAMATGCKQALDGLKQGAKAMGCEI